MELHFVHSEKKQLWNYLLFEIHWCSLKTVTEKCFSQEMTTGNSFIAMVTNSGLTTSVVL